MTKPKFGHKLDAQDAEADPLDDARVGAQTPCTRWMDQVLMMKPQYGNQFGVQDAEAFSLDDATVRVRIQRTG